MKEEGEWFEMAVAVRCGSLPLKLKKKKKGKNDIFPNKIRETK